MIWTSDTGTQPAENAGRKFFSNGLQISRLRALYDLHAPARAPAAAAPSMRAWSARVALVALKQRRPVDKSQPASKLLQNPGWWYHEVAPMEEAAGVWFRWP